ncbi:hypothetical protein KOR42_22000 [Thalassoglobus neptunius]|uniref:Uncharacterized protein n=1 Tax=Thalassoglobus neptunius TaxID=1938619 RepID=A0A5C5X7D5_9PLAN|nr:hypothetical protein [Thalassoglobus neptunius]TWT58814.1 hypothetical protein KOR42_22000 [Thalassoglobus neptunius]
MWFTENAWQPMLLFAILAMIAAFGWYRRLQTRYLVLCFCCLGMMGVAWYADRTIVTEREKVQEAILEITHAFAAKDFEGVHSRISQRSLDLRTLADMAMNLATLENMRVTDIQVELKSEATRAVSRFRVNALITSERASAREPAYIEARWQTEEGRWRMIDVKFLDPITGDVEADLMQLRRNHLTVSDVSRWRF